MGPISTTKASLRLFGDDLDPDEITQQLGGKPTKAARKGERIRNEGTGREHIARNGRWSLRVEDRTPGDLDGQIRQLLEGLTADLSIWAALSEKYKVDLFCGLFMEDGNEGELLAADTLHTLGSRYISLALDIYGPD